MSPLNFSDPDNLIFEPSITFDFFDLLFLRESECFDKMKLWSLFSRDFSRFRFSIEFLYLVEFVKNAGTILMLGLSFFKEMFDFLVTETFLHFAESLIFFSLIVCKDGLPYWTVEIDFSTTAEFL